MRGTEAVAAPERMTIEQKVRETNRRLRVLEVQLSRLDRSINGSRPSAESSGQQSKVPEVSLHMLLDEASPLLSSIEESIEWITRGLGFTDAQVIAKERSELG